MSSSDKLYKTYISYIDGQRYAKTYDYQGNLSNSIEDIHDSQCGGRLIHIEDSEKGNIAYCNKCSNYWTKQLNS